MTSKIKVDNINKVSDDSNIIKKCGSTITVGAGSDATTVAGTGALDRDWETLLILSTLILLVIIEIYILLLLFLNHLHRH